MSDLDIIKQLEREIRGELPKIEFDSIMMVFKNGYSLDEEGRVIGLNLDKMQLSKLPQSLFKLTNLKALSLFDNNIKELPIEIFNLTNLHSLDLVDNQLSALPVEICNLTNLQSLNLAYNQLSALPVEIVNLTNLQSLDLAYNQLSALPVEITKLAIEIKWDYDGKGKGIYLADNPLETPPIEIVKQGREAVIEYFKSIADAEERRALNEVKVLLVGDGGAGKTSLMKCIKGEEFDLHESQTKGINIKEWEVDVDSVDIDVGEKNIKVNFWDFGGQVIMHATHQFFLSKRSLYVLVLDGRKDQKPENWLKLIESFGGDSPVMVVLNKIDENPGHEVNRLFLQRKYKGIKGFYRLSCQTGKGVKKFRDEFIGNLSKMEMIRTVWGGDWFKVKERLEKLDECYISYDYYKGICEESGVNEKPGQDNLAGFLHDLGIIVHFKDFELLDTHVIEPKWVTKAIYKIINSKVLADHKGILHLNRLDEILIKESKDDYDYPSGQYPFIINLMKKFELCFEMGKNRILIPDLLDVQEPEIDFDYDNSLGFVIDYIDFLPKSVTPRFIVKMHKDIEGKLRWRTGVVLKNKAFNSRAIIRADELARKICINVSGEQKREYFSVILFNLRELNLSFEKLEFDERVALPDSPDKTVSYGHLTTLEKMNEETYIPEGSTTKYNIKDLLGNIYVIKDSKEEVLEYIKDLVENFLEMSDKKETVLDSANKIVMAQPNFMGLGINFNAAIKKAYELVSRKKHNK